MVLDIVTKDSINRSVTIRIIDSSDGTPETGVVWNTSGIDLWYRREGAAVTSITEATLSALTDAHSDGGFLHVSHGYYRLDLPDAAFATGANYVDVGGTVTGMVVIGGRVRLVDVDLEDSVRAGLTALPNAAADAAGGLPVSDAGSLDLDGLNTNVSAVLTDTGTTLPATLATLATSSALATVDTNVDAILVDTGTTLPATLSGLATSAALATVDTNVDAILVDTGTTIPAQITALNNLSAAEVNAEVVDVLRTDTIPDTYSADGAQPTIAQAILAIHQFLQEREVSGTTVTVKKPDGSTSAMTFTLDDATTPTSITRAT